ncbi:3-dehydroquinate synthase [Acidimicrobiia bacterium]|nr:3-dehydroquinate synthase [Acidimicrobiia bacterium]MDA9275842.1 3-dehydroquinate synthase [Acidimicrobiia bacterium]
MQKSNVRYFENLKELITYCEKIIDNKNCLTFVDENVLTKFPILQNTTMNLKKIEIKEDEKNLNTVTKIWEDMFEQSIQRTSTIFSIGGGVMSDSIGFAASTYKRGTSLILIPTTLLSMVDAAHGGKNGINTKHGKNQLGTFMIPEEVLICPEFLNELPENQIKSGLIELIKAGFLKNPELVEEVYDIDITKINIELIKSAIDIKNGIVESDFKETSERMYLNFGHTIGHLIEIDSNHRISHGEAVAIGILKALRISEKKCNLDTVVVESFENFLKKLEFDIDYKFNSELNQLRDLLSNDKKSSNNIVRYVLLRNIGDPILIDYNLDELLNELNYA